MDTSKSIAKNTIALYISQIISMLSGIVFVFFAARYLGREGIGQYMLAFSYLVIFQTFSQFGLGELLIREIARHKQEVNQYILNAIFIRLVFSIIAFLALLLMIRFAGYSHKTTLVILIIGSSLIPAAGTTVYTWILIGFEKMGYIAITTIVTSILKITIGVPLLLMGYSVIAIAVMFLLLNVLSMIIELFFVNRNVARIMPKFSFDYKFSVNLLRSALPFVFISIFVVIFNRIDKVMLSKMKDIIEVGIYGAAYKFLGFFQTAAGSFNVSIYPVLSKFFQSSRDSFNNVVQKSLKYELIILLPLVVLCFIFADKIILLFYGKKFIGSIVVLKILVLAAIPFTLNYTFSRAVLSSNNQRVTVRIAGVNVIANVLLNFLLIPRYGAAGAAFATLVTFSTACVQNYVFVSRNVCNVELLKAIGKPGLAVVLITVLAMSIRNINAIIVVLLSLITYVGLLVVLRALSREDIYLFKRVLLRKKPNL